MTDFFARQEAARRSSRRLVWLFVLALLAVLVAVNAVVLFAANLFMVPEPGVDLAASQRRLALWVTLLVTAIIVGGSLVRLRSLAAGGGTVARALGGERVTADTAEPLRRRLLNVVEEMAIASGVPVPEVYVLEQEGAINAFAAGHNPANAAVAVTRGALEQLDRDQLQGVIAHEFSHILNGDMRLNMRLIGLLYGLLMVAIAAELLFQGFARSRRGVRVATYGGRRNNAGAAIAVLLIIAGAIWAIGRIGVFFGRLIQAGVSRNRERLADAAALQFTRQPDGLKGALIRIATTPGGSRIHVPNREQVAHMLFAAGMRRGFATHPPLIERIWALDPRFDAKELDRLRAERVAEGMQRQAAASTASAGGTAAPPLGAISAPLNPAALIGTMDATTLALAAELRAGVPDAMHRASASADSAASLLLALALDPESALAGRQLEEIGRHLGAARSTAVAGWLDAVRTLPVQERLPVLQLQFASLHHWPRAERERLVDCLAALPRPGDADVTAWAAGRVAQGHLLDELDPHGEPWVLALDQVKQELATLFAVLARHGNPDPVAARRAYEMGLSRLLPRERPAYAPPAHWAPQLDAALAVLDRLSAPARELLLDGLVQVIQHDGQLTRAEAELLRAVCAVLHCPLPPLLAAADAGDGPG